MNTSTKEKQTHRHREQACVCKIEGLGRVGLEVWNQQMQNIIDINIMDKQQVLLYSTGNYIQHLVMNHNGKEYEKEYICVCVCVYTYIYICLSHFAVHQKLTQH